MSTLADELLQDFEDSGSDREDVQSDGGLDGVTGPSLRAEVDDDEDMQLDGDEEPFEDGGDDHQMGGLDGVVAEVPEDDDEAKAAVEKMQLGAVKDVRKVSTIMDRLQPLLKDIARFQEKPLAPGTINVGNIEDNPEYKVLTQSNTLSTQINGEIMKVHKFIRDHYSSRFPELETLIQNPVEYAKVVAILGNGPMDSENMRTLQTSTDNILGQSLKAVLDGPSLMVVTVEATTTKGEELSPEELDRVIRACEMMIAMDKAKATLTDYVQSRMNVFAPNLTAIVGSLTAAQLINTAGGLTPLSRTPACNLPSWGSKKPRLAFASNTSVKSQGYIYESPLIRGIPTDLKKKAMKAVAAKLVLAARADTGHSSPDGSYGEELRSQCLERLDKMTEPPPNKGQRALPAPDDKPSRKRGGRRARKAKEATAMTDLRKAQNRMAFNKEEKETGYGTGDSTAGMGMIGASNDGRIRGIQIDNRTRAKLSQKHKGWGGASTIGGAASSLRGFGQTPGQIDLRGKGLRTSGVGSTIGGGAGTASSLAFTPVQGLELVDPSIQAELNRKRKAEEDRWFSGGTFTQVGGGGSATNGGFKVPGLPASKKVDTGQGKMLPPALPAKK
ncbi:Prp31 C terminal domain-containing protein [Microdochium trichocladiopsis]|uniref:Prp31 C terminal domain-containing protein n=1 Tax=Microdochium trichocladiopsis TaxID=1682393 RepID=A0A9P8Y1H9_9PEZI|nr:Prp31 C terminal domain-containing protein [Microdochium trichocladiopsis]KAH7026341.1 Prp31 C terminal domain-containing protein [Microdochium trichocladiopsis]